MHRKDTYNYYSKTYILELGFKTHIAIITAKYAVKKVLNSKINKYKEKKVKKQILAYIPTYNANILANA